MFATWPLADIVPPVTRMGGAVKLRLPAETMHTFKAPNNRVVWSVQVRGEIPRWPDVEDEFPLQVDPRPLTP